MRRQKKLGRPLRDGVALEQAWTRATPAELKSWQRWADRLGISRAEYIRRCVVAATGGALP